MRRIKGTKGQKGAFGGKLFLPLKMKVKKKIEGELKEVEVIYIVSVNSPRTFKRQINRLIEADPVLKKMVRGE